MSHDTSDDYVDSGPRPELAPVTTGGVLVSSEEGPIMTSSPLANTKIVRHMPPPVSPLCTKSEGSSPMQLDTQHQRFFKYRHDITRYKANEIIFHLYKSKIFPN